MSYRVVQTIHVEIPEDECVWGGVMDDVDDDGRGYNRAIEGPATVIVDLVEATGDDGWQPSRWEVRDEALGLTDAHVEELLADFGCVEVPVGEGIGS